MNICIIGAGYAGLISGACLAEAGNRVICIDKDREKIEYLQKGILPIYEPYLEELVQENMKAGRLYFSLNLEKAIRHSLVIMITVGTPESPDGSADLTYVKEAAADIARVCPDYRIIVTKSTIPVGTGKVLQDIIEANLRQKTLFGYASCPEFLREGAGIWDHLNMERAVIGTADEYAGYILERIYRPFTKNILLTTVATAELIKYASNAFLASKVTFINQIANICERVGADVTQVAAGMGLDHRIGKSFLQAGVGYGGSCFPKDTRALLKTSQAAGYNFTMLSEVIRANEAQKLRVVEKIRQVHGSLKEKTIAVLGLTFKPNTDDIRCAPSHQVIEVLLKEGAFVKAYDPLVWRIKESSFKGASLNTDLYETLKGCQGAIILTEWEQIKNMDLQKAKDCLDYPLLIDGRNIFSPQKMKDRGFIYLSIGREQSYN